MINGYELGQYLRILLWIGVPAVVFYILVTNWLHYRRTGNAGRLQLSIEGLAAGEDLPGGQAASRDSGYETASGNSGYGTDRSSGLEDGRVEELAPQTEDEYKESLYKGILWMKEKYEHYRDLADERYERLREQLNGVEKRYQDLLDSVRAQGSGVALLPVQGEQEKDRIIANLEDQARLDRQKIEELVNKLKNNSQLLMKIYQELDKSIHLTAPDPGTLSRSGNDVRENTDIPHL